MPEKGSVVLATAGRDAGRLFAVLECSEKDCLLADGPAAGPGAICHGPAAAMRTGNGGT